MCTSMGQLKVAQAVLVSLKTEGPSLTLMQKLAGQESSRQWRKTRLEQKASRRMQRSAKKIKGEMDQNQRSFRPEREREMSVEDGEGRPVAPSGVEYPAPEIPEDPNERAKLKREVMPGSPTSEAKAKPKVSPQQVMRRGGLSIASGPPLTKANPSPTQEGVKRTAEEGTGDLESIEPLLSKRRFQPQHQQRRVHQTQEH